MPNFICEVCGEKATYPKTDAQIHEKRKWECPLCYSVIAKGRYEQNIKGSTTLFTNMGPALGDRIVQEPLKRFYCKQNPDENIIFLDEGIRPGLARKKYKYTKFFWGDVNNNENKKIPQNVIHFFLCNEVNELARKEFYANCPVKSEPVNFLIFNSLLNNRQRKGWIVIHARNQHENANGKATWKNTSYDQISEITSYLESQTVVLIGNDHKFEYEHFGKHVLDFRNKLSLGELRWVIEHSNGFIGIDSGPAHFAGTCRKLGKTGIPIVGFGFRNKQWFPKTPNPSIFLMKNQSSTYNIIKAIDRIILK